MTLFALNVQRRPRWLRYLLIAALVSLLEASTDLLPQDYEVILWSFGVIGVILRVFIGNFYKSVLMRIFVTESTLTKNRVVQICNIAFILGLVAMMFGSSNGAIGPVPIGWIMILTFGIRLLAVLLQREILFNGRTAGGLMRITGVHPKALLAMEKLLPEGRRMPPKKSQH